MESRRSFLVKGSLSLVAIQVPLIGCSKKLVYGNPKKKNPKSAAVVWYSQTGNTERAGKLIAKRLELSGLSVTASDYRDFNREDLKAVDLIIGGSPVYYYDVPTNFQDWLKQIPEIKDISIASFVTFGGEGGNQHNTSRTLAQLLTDKGGIPVGTAEFGNMSTFAVTWSIGNINRILKYKDKPNEDTFNTIRSYTDAVLDRIQQGLPVDIEKDFDFRDMIRSSPSIWGTKLFLNNHKINRKTCIGCEICLQKCPVDAIDLNTGEVNDDRCIVCLGCVNNCPTGSVDMAFMNSKIYGFNDFLKRQNITITEPVELKSTDENNG